MRRGETLLITEEPVSIGQYVEFLRDTGQPVPEQWQGIRPGVAGADLPVTGLTRREAEQFAAWDMKRLPSPEEWQEADEVTAGHPYPWSDGSPSEPGAELFLVQNWLPGSPGEQKARQRKEGLPAEILAEYQQQVDGLRQQLRQMVDRLQERRAALWQEAKPAFFNLLEKKKELALKEAEQRRTEVVEVLQTLLTEKGQLAVKLKTQDPDPEQADQMVQQYGRRLSDALAKVQEVRQSLEEKTKELQDEVVRLTQEFEEGEAERLTALSEHVRTALQGAEQEARSMEGVLALRQRLRDALQEVRDRAPALEELPTADELEQQAARLEQRIRQVAEDAELAQKVEDLRSRLKTVGETIDREFLKEDVLYKELSELVDLRARKEAIEAKLEALKAAFGEEPEAEEDPPESPSATSP
ncbi:MAG: SUMF1/EgtB/PvdO family nonheme iron enzyme [Candidatus Brocadiaceae bacterium]